MVIPVEHHDRLFPIRRFTHLETNPPLLAFSIGGPNRQDFHVVDFLDRLLDRPLGSPRGAPRRRTSRRVPGGMRSPHAIAAIGAFPFRSPTVA